MACTILLRICRVFAMNNCHCTQDAETTTENCCGVEGRRLRKQTQTILALYVEAIVVRKKKFDMLLQMVDML